MAFATQTDRTKSVCNRCVIEVFGGDFVLSRCFFDSSVGLGAFVIGLSQIYPFFLTRILSQFCISNLSYTDFCLFGQRNSFLKFKF